MIPRNDFTVKTECLASSSVTRTTAKCLSASKEPEVATPSKWRPLTSSICRTFITHSVSFIFPFMVVMRLLFIDSGGIVNQSSLVIKHDNPIVALLFRGSALASAIPGHAVRANHSFAAHWIFGGAQVGFAARVALFAFAIVQGIVAFAVGDAFHFDGAFEIAGTRFDDAVAAHKFVSRTAFGGWAHWCRGRSARGRLGRCGGSHWLLSCGRGNGCRWCRRSDW
jgi:hypothetical protein